MPMPTTERIRTLIRSQAEIPVPIENALLDLAATCDGLQAALEILCADKIEPPAPRPRVLQMSERLEQRA